MKTIKFHVQGSMQEPYVVTFEKTGLNLNAYCTCPAGDNGQVCKHRLNILLAVTDGIVSNNIEQVSEVCELLKGTDVEGALNQVYAAEEELKHSQDKLKRAKKNLAMAMRK